MFSRRMLSVLGRVLSPTRPHVITGHIHAVTDMKTGETFLVQYQQTMRDTRGRIRATRVLAARS